MDIRYCTCFFSFSSWKIIPMREIHAQVSKSTGILFKFVPTNSRINGSTRHIPRIDILILVAMLYQVAN